ncbi:MAG: hypothetical protein LCH73_07685 [Proteobacteria bacterium]|nr:hypothetical protein [Pseudomonadota bacterium]
MKLTHLIPLLAALGAAPLAQAESGASSASSAGSASVGSLSNSLQASSNSSNQRQVAAGDYRITHLARAGDGVQVALAPMGQGEAFTLTLPQTVADQQGLAVGGVIAVQARDYGLAFAQAGQPFFLALADDWYRALDAQPV